MKIIKFLTMLTPLLSFSQSADIYENNEYGLPVKVGEIKEGANNSIDVYKINSYNLPEKVETLSPNNNGGYDVGKINKYGLPDKTGEVRFTPSITPSFSPSRR